MLFAPPEDIFTASSELGIDGTIEIESVETNFQRQLEQSELRLLNTDAIANSCLARQTRQTSFTISGNGGTPRTPNTNYSDLNSTLRVGTLVTPTRINLSRQLEPNGSMVPAEKMVETQDGRILLIAAPKSPESIFCQPIFSQK